MTLISIILTVVFTALILFMGYLGYKKGFIHSLANLIKTAAATIIAFLITFLAIPAVNTGEIIKKSLPEIFNTVASFADESAASQLLGSLSNIIVTPIVFVIAFGIVSIVLWIVQSAVIKKIQKEKTESTKKRVIGGVINAVKTFMVICLCILPLAAVAGTVGYTIDTVALEPKHQTAADENARIGDEDVSFKLLGYSVIEKGLLKKDGIADLKETYVSPISDNLYIKASYSTPMRAFVNSMAHIASTKNCVIEIADLAELILSADIIYNASNAIETSNFAVLSSPEIDEQFFYEIFDILYNSTDLKGFIPYITCLPLTVISENMEIAAPTPTALPEMTDEDLKKEGEIFTFMLNGISPVIETIEGLSDITDNTEVITSLDLVAIGKYLDNIRSSKFISASADEFILNALHSSAFKSLGSIATVIESHLVQDIERKNNGETTKRLVLADVFTTLEEIFTVLLGYKNGEYTIEDLQKSLSSLNVSLRANGMTAAELLKDILNMEITDNSSSIISLGGTDSGALSQKVMNFFVDRLSENEISEDHMGAEASSVNFMLQIATEVSKDEGMTFDSFINICTSNANSSGMDVNGLVDSVGNSTFISEAITSVVYDKDESGNTVLHDDIKNLTSTVTSENKNEFEDFCKSTYVAVAEDKGYDQSQLGTVEQNINSIGSIIGVQIPQSQFDTWLDEASTPTNTPEAPEVTETTVSDDIAEQLPDNIANQIPDGVTIPDNIPDDILNNLPAGVTLP